MAAAPRTIVITVPAKSGLAFRKPAAVSIQGQAATANQPVALQQRLIRTAPIAAARVVTPAPTATFVTAAALGKRPASDLENTDPFVVIQPPRKRERLTHLSPEEKLNRRKLKNRVAAQTARDRKKLRTNTLEESVQILSTENQELLAENARLRQRLSQLSAENTRLKRSAERVEPEDEKPPKIDNMAGDRSSDAFGSAVGSSVPTTDPGLVGPSDDVSDVDLQRILDDLLKGTEFYHASGVESDPLGADECDGAEDPSAVDSDSDRHVDGSVEGVETQAGGGVRMSFVPLDSLKLDMDDEPSTQDAFISGLGASQPPTVAIVDHQQQITQLVPGSPYHDPTSPVTPISAYNSQMPLLDADLLDKALDKQQSDATFVDADPFLEAPVWEDTFTDLFGLVA